MYTFYDQRLILDQLIFISKDKNIILQLLIFNIIPNPLLD
jgi:hypothetical protein